MSEQRVDELRKCIRSDLDCADICEVTARVLSRHTNITRAQLQACIQACESCGDECARHAAMHAHCRICAEECRRRAETCRSLLAKIS
ncbi:four-helix bundle copper-binding protein [Parasphingorhabdus pacifica]